MVIADGVAVRVERVIGRRADIADVANPVTIIIELDGIVVERAVVERDVDVVRIGVGVDLEEPCGSALSVLRQLTAAVGAVVVSALATLGLCGDGLVPTGSVEELDAPSRTAAAAHRVPIEGAAEGAVTTITAVRSERAGAVHVERAEHDATAGAAAAAAILIVEADAGNRVSTVTTVGTNGAVYGDAAGCIDVDRGAAGAARTAGSAGAVVVAAGTTTA